MKTKILVLAILASLFMVACNDDDDIKMSFGDVKMELPAVLKNAKISKMTATIENVNTGLVLTRDVSSLSLVGLDLEDGVYNIKVEGTANYQTSYVVKHEDDDGNVTEETVTKDVISEVRGAKENVEIQGGSFSVNVPLFLVSKSTGFVISEIYFTGSKTPKGKQYNEDKFFEIYNNSNETLYADGLCIAETQLLTAMSLNEYTPDIRNEATPVSAVYRVPGTGKEHPVKPGETLVLCDVGINHKIENPNSIDLSKANFEWYDDSKFDADTPEVPNLEKMVSKSKSVWSLHNRGYKGYILFRPETTLTPEQFTTDYAYAYKYHFVFGKFERWMDFEAWKVPNTWVIDAVQCSTPSKFEWTVMSPELDLTWTYSGDADDARYGHSVKRKISHKEGDRIVLQDTNDSASDFIPTAPNPSPGTVADHK